MKNKSGKPFAAKKLNDDGYWEIYFNPTKKLDGNYYYDRLTGAIDIETAETLVDILNEERDSFD